MNNPSSFLISFKFSKSLVFGNRLNNQPIKIAIKQADINGTIELKSWYIKATITGASNIKPVYLIVVLNAFAI